MKSLSLQGGGVLGYGQTVILSELEKLTNKQCFQLFDICAGTSVGCIIGACLSIGIPASDILSFFTVDAPNIFKKNIFNSISQLWGPKYNSKPIETALQNRLKNYTLKDCKTKFLSTSYDWATDRPVYFKSYEKSQESKDWIIIGNDSDIQMWQIARASSAAQTYFSSYVYKDKVLMDGGNGGDNTPDTLCISECINFSDIKNIQMLSLGAGDTKWNVSTNSMISPCIARAGLETIKIVFSAGEAGDVYKASQILNERYFRLSPDLGNGYSIDDASQNTLVALQTAAQTLVDANQNILIQSVS